jgi:hypothetical protein
MLKPALVPALALVSGCATMHIHSQVAPETDLGHYHAYAWLPTSKGGPETVLDQQIRSSLRQPLTQRGLREAPPDAADFLIGYRVLQEHKVTIADWGNGIYGWAPDVVAYTDGTLIVDFIDPKTNRIFWRGSATAAICNPGIVNVKRVDKAASEIVRRYP